MSTNKKNKRRDELKQVSGGYDVVNFVPTTSTDDSTGVTYTNTTMHNRIAPHIVVDLGTASSGLKVGGNATFIDSSVRNIQHSLEGTVTKTTTY